MAKRLSRIGGAYFASAVALAAMLATSSTSSAQTTPAPLTDADPAKSASEIVVTAQKRNERLGDVPIAISVVSPALLASTNSRNLSELNGVIPGAFFASSSGGGRTYVTLRGATGLALNTGDEPVAIYVDDVYQARGVTVGMSDFLDIGSVEIVRGPQGTLQGRNATAGAILIRSADPTDVVSGRVTASIADPLEFRGQAAVSGPLGEGLKGRLAIGYANERGWAYNTATRNHDGGGRSIQGRATLVYDGDSPFSLRLVADATKLDNNPALFRYGATTFSPLTTGPLVPAGTATPNTPLPAAQRDEIFNQNRISVSPGTNTTVKTYGTSLKMGYDFGGAELISVTGVRRTTAEGINDSDGLDTARQGYNHNDDRSTSYSEEIRLQSTGNKPFSWIIGGYYGYERQFYTDDIYNLRLTTAFDGYTRYTGVIRSRTYSAFADATYAITPQLSVIGGIRRTHDKKDINAKFIAYNLTANTQATTILTPNGVGKPAVNTWDDTSYRAKLVYRPTPGVMLYGGYSRGFRAGGYNPFANQGPYNPEINKSLEVGAKADLFDRKLNLSMAAFRNRYSNLQLRAGVPSGGAIVTNAADSTIKGLEVEAYARPTDHLRLTATAAFTDARFVSFPTARNTLDQPTDATGNRLPRTPKSQFYLAAENDFPVSDSLVVTAEANYRWRSKIFFYFTNQNDQPWQGPTAGELGARIALHPDDRAWNLALYGTNLTNTRSISSSGITFSYNEVGLNKPRVIGISGEVRF